MGDTTLFTTSEGVKIQVRAVAQTLVDKVRSGLSLPEPPCYKEVISLPGQDKIENYIPMKRRDDARTPEEFEAWDNYEIVLRRARADHARRMLDAIIVPAVCFDIELPEDDTWAEIHNYIGADVPENGVARKAHYVLYELLKAPEDLVGLISTVMRTSGISEEAVKVAEDSFRNSLRRPDGQAAQGD